MKKEKKKQNFLSKINHKSYFKSNFKMKTILKLPKL